MKFLFFTNLQLFLSKAKNLFLDILFPNICFHCHQLLQANDNILCSTCYKTILLNSTLFCPTCHARQPDNHPVCHFHNNFSFGSATNYHIPVIKQLTHLLKFGSQTTIASFFGDLLIKYIQQTNLNLADFNIIPIPLSSARLRQRGFNQAHLIASHFANYYHLPLLKNALTRPKATKPQASLLVRDRLLNIHNCFTVPNPTLIQNKNIILIDDVFTSGLTVRTAVTTLKSAGAKRILVLTVSKA